MIVGIDNGIDGGICAVSPHGKIIDKCPMPILKRKGSGRWCSRSRSGY